MRMSRIPFAAAQRIAETFGYDQVVIIARRVGEDPEPHGEHCTTYGVTRAHCDVAARIGEFFTRKLMGWPDLKAAKDTRAMEIERAARAVVIAYDESDGVDGDGGEWINGMDELRRALDAKEDQWPR